MFELVERPDGDVAVPFGRRRRVRASAQDGVDLGPDDDAQLVVFAKRQVELAVAQTRRGARLGLVGAVEGVGVLKRHLRGVLLDDLQLEVGIDESRLERKRRRSVERVGLVRLQRRVRSVFVDAHKV